VKVRVNNGKVDLTIRRITAENVMVSFYDLFEDHVIEGGLLLCAGICMLTSWLSVRRKTGSGERAISIYT
jgi:hypothetical protein